MISIVSRATLCSEYETEMKAKLDEYVPRSVFGFFHTGKALTYYDHEQKSILHTHYDDFCRRNKIKFLHEIEKTKEEETPVVKDAVCKAISPNVPRDEHFVVEHITNFQDVFGYIDLNLSFKALAMFSNMALRKAYNEEEKLVVDNKFCLWLTSQPDLNHRKINIQEYIYNENDNQNITLIPKLFKNKQQEGIGVQMIEIYPYSVIRKDELQINDTCLDITSMFVEPIDDAAMSSLNDDNNEVEQNNKEPNDFYGDLKAVAPRLQDAIDAYNAINVS